MEIDINTPQSSDYNHEEINEDLIPFFLHSNDSIYLYHSRSKTTPFEEEERKRKDSILECIENRFINTRILDSREKEYIRNIIYKNPDIIHNIQEEIRYIHHQQEKIELHDLPEIILIIYRIYQQNMVENAVENLCITNLIDFTMDILLEKKRIYVPNTEKMVIRKMIKTSLNLLDTNTHKIIKDHGEECCIIDTLYQFFSWFIPV
jgi:hypothetical protein